MSGFPRLIGTAFFLVFLACGTRVERQQSEPAPAPSIQESPSVRLRAATLVKFPAKVDCNSRPTGTETGCTSSTQRPNPGGAQGTACLISVRQS